MPALTIKNIPDELYRSLKQSAAMRHRSINREAIYCLERALGSVRVDPDRFLEQAQRLRQRIKAPKLTERFLREAKREGRP